MLPRDFTIQEQKVEEILSELGYRYEVQYDCGKYTVDFFLPEINTVIEVDGIYGHFKKADKERDNWLLHMGIGKIIHINKTGKTKIKLQLEQLICQE